MAYLDDPYSKPFQEKRVATKEKLSLEDIEHLPEQTYFTNEYNPPAIHRLELLRNYLWTRFHRTVERLRKEMQ